MRVHTEPAMFVPADDAVGNLPVSVGVAASRLHSDHLGAHRYVLGQVGRVLPVLEHRRVVVDVQHRDHHLAQRGVTWRALVAGTGLQLIHRLHFAVQGALQGDHAALLVNGEETISRVGQGVDDVTVMT